MIKLRRKTNEQFLHEMSVNHPTLQVLSEYKNNRTKVDLKCNVCGYKFSAKASSLYMKHGCPKCAGMARKTTEEFIEEMRSKNDNIIVLGEYKNSKTPIEVSCRKCGHVWSAIPNSLLKGNSCPKCAGTMRKTQEQFVLEMKKKHPTIKVIGTYTNNKTKLLCLCKNCGKYFRNVPHTMLNGGNGCPNCTKSRGENKIKNWLNEHEFDYQCQKTFDDCKDIHVLPFDFYLPKYNTIIEYDGIQHFKSKEFFGGERSFRILQKHDKIKNDYCSQNAIRLIRIPYTDYDNIDEILNDELAS